MTATTSRADVRPAGLVFDVRPSAEPMAHERRLAMLADPGFGQFFTDHMVRASWSAERGWHDGVVGPYAPFELDPSAAVFHYAQEVFEGLKAYRRTDGSIWTFRPEVNARRFIRSARRLALPELPEQAFLDAVDGLVRIDVHWFPDGPETTLYLRPFMFASEPFLGVRSSMHVTFAVIASPAGSYFKGGVAPVNIWISRDYSRAAPGGTGAAKCGGNYASSLAAQDQAYEHGCEQVAFLDVVERRYLEELGGMNIVTVADDGTLRTPSLEDGTILEGVTRDAVLQVAADFGLGVEEAPVAVDRLMADLRSGAVREVFACGTAAVVTPIGRFVDGDTTVTVADGAMGEVTRRIRERLLDIQGGTVEDTHGWMHRVA